MLPLYIVLSMFSLIIGIAYQDGDDDLSLTDVLYYPFYKITDSKSLSKPGKWIMYIILIGYRFLTFPYWVIYNSFKALRSFMFNKEYL